jgi:hypothetical protein
LLNLQSVHKEKNLVVALEKELYPIFYEKFRDAYDERLRDRFSQYTTKVDFKTRFDEFYASF